MIPQSFIQDLLNRVDIVALIDGYVPLKKAGQNYQACCPFHQEKSPSFSVSPSKQFYHCFGCGAHGTAISFLMEHQGMGFVDAVTALAQRTGMPVPNEPDTPNPAQQQQAKEQRNQLQEALETASQYYRQQLKKAPLAIDYLKQRGLTGVIAAKFGLGYAPDGWQNLSDCFADYQTQKSIIENGLVVQNEQGKRYDRFRERIIFPIINPKGDIIGFGGRVITGGTPKYLNSPETPLFEKGKELYGLYHARSAIKSDGMALVVEGYMDVIMLAQQGVECAVATLGTATTAQHIQTLMRYTDKLVFCFDGDKAGRKAAWRALENALPMLKDDKKLEFVFLPDGEDPDSYAKEHGKAGFMHYLQEKSLPLSAFFIQELSRQVDLSSQEGHAHLIHLAKPLIAQIKAPALSILLKRRLSELMDLGAHDLNVIWSPPQPKKPTFNTKPKEGYKTQPQKPFMPRTPRIAPSLCRKLIGFITEEPPLAQQIQPESLAELPRTNDTELLLRVLEICHSTPNISSLHLFEHLRGHHALLKLAREEVSLVSPSDRHQEFYGALNAFNKQLAHAQIETLKKIERTQGLNMEQQHRLLQLLKLC